MAIKESKISYYLSGIILAIALIVIIGVAGYYTISQYREYTASKKIKEILGFLPGKDNKAKNSFSRKLDFYTVSQNTPNFNFSAYNSEFKSDSLISDSNGFITGGTQLTVNKEANTIRIFLTGGSAAFGSIQAHTEVDDTYPAGSYSYNASIAGYLKEMLEKKYPGLKFEVINAAVVQHLFNQNFAMYFEKLRNFRPDIIISMDGWNDAGLFVYSKHNGDPYQMTDKQSDEALTLELLSRYGGSYSSMLANLEGQRKSETAGKKNKMAGIPFTALEESSYKRIEPLYINNSQKLLWLYDSYLQQMQHDSVYAIVALQPMLERREKNKKLSPLEMKFRNTIETNVFYWAANNFDDIVEKGQQGYFTGMGNQKYNIVDFIDAYFFDKYFSPALDAVVKKHNAVYVDIGNSMAGMGADKEFYVDYCHMTPYGNKFIAGIFEGYVSDHLKNKMPKGN